MPRNNSKFSWSILIRLYLCMAVVSSANVAYPDSYEMYSYKQPRTMNDLQNQHMRQAMVDVTETINEVQKILRKDPKLPRLTRGEIEDLFEMVTREEYKRSLAAGDYERAKHMRSLMLVLPFNTNNFSEERLEELFTQMPVTKMVNGVPKSPKPQRIVLPPTMENSVPDSIGAHSAKADQKLPTTFKPNFPTNMKTMYTAPVTTFHPKGNAQNPTMLYPKSTVQTNPGYSQQNPPQMMHPFYQPKTTMHAVPMFHQNPNVQHSTGYNRKITPGPMMNHYLKSTGQRISPFSPKSTVQTAPANAIPTNYISTYHPKPNTYKVTKESSGISIQPSIATASQHKYSSRFNAETTYFVTPSPVTPTMRPQVKHLLATIGLEPDDNAIEINNQMSEMQKPSTQMKPSATTEITPTTSTTLASSSTKPELTAELKEILQSFGLLTNEERPVEATDDTFKDEFHPIFPSSLKDETLSVSEFKPLPKSVTASDIKEKIENSYEIKPDDFTSFKPLPIKENQPAKDQEFEKLLKSYGILEDDQKQENKTENVEEEIEPVEEEKVTEMSEIPEVNVEFLSPELRQVLGNIGVRNVKKDDSSNSIPSIARRVDKVTTDKVTTESSTVGVVPSSNMENDYQKLHLLLDTIKELDSLTANLTDEELDKLNLKNFNFSQNNLAENIGPDPTYDVESEANQAKNEVKRQTNPAEPTRFQFDIPTSPTPSTSTTASVDSDSDSESEDESISDGPKSDTTTTTEATERKAKQENLNTGETVKDDDDVKADETEQESKSASTSSTTEETKNGSISDLAESFGGNDGLDPVSEEPLPPPRKNGFYFFSDWNSFLEVGEDPDKVVVRFDPKIGDQTPFLQVKIP